MLSKRTHPMIGKISELLVGVNRSTSPTTTSPFFDVFTTSPKSPLDFKILPQISKRNISNSSKRFFYEDNLGGSVGLAIVAALEKNSTTSVCRSEPNRSCMSKPVMFMNQEEEEEEEEDEEMFIMDEEEEDYTLVTCHNGFNGSCKTRVYDKDGVECYTSKVNEDDHRERLFVVDVCTESPVFHDLGFLNSCYLCRKTLHGQDIFIYRGEKAFCSTECRSSHIANDENKKRCIDPSFRPLRTPPVKYSPPEFL
ncbi:unnamed protein product [Cochlearia groenlandica]